MRHALRGSEAAPGRWRALHLLGLAPTVGGLACVARGSETWQMATAGHSTATAEIREITLPDGTRIVLGCTSAIDLHFDERERRGMLRAGVFSRSRGTLLNLASGKPAAPGPAVLGALGLGPVALPDSRILRSGASKLGSAGAEPRPTAVRLVSSDTAPGDRSA